MPLAWDELTSAEDIRRKFTVKTVPQRDAWADYWKTKQGITDAMWKALGASRR